MSQLDRIVRVCLRGRSAPASLAALWDRASKGSLDAPPLTRLLTSLDALDAGYGPAIEAEGGEVAANVRAHRRLFERLGFFAEDDDGSLWAFDLASPAEEPPVAVLDTGGQYTWRGIDLAQALAVDSDARYVATQFLPSLTELHARHYAEETGAPLPPYPAASGTARADDPETWLGISGEALRALLGADLPGDQVAACDEEGRVSTVWLPREGSLASLAVRGVVLGATKESVLERLGAPTTQRPAWVRFDGGGRALHLEVTGGVVSRVTLMALRAPV
jgi:hypothetical protein